jgi:predicted Zn-dependent protease with MMP-like domain
VVIDIEPGRFEEMVGADLDGLPEDLHEIGHHFGIDDDRLRELGW